MEGFRWNITQDNSNEEIDGLQRISWRRKHDGLKYLILDNLWIMKHEENYQEWHNTTSKDKRERIALRNARWRMLELVKTTHVLSTMFILEYSLTDHNFERNLEEQLKNEKNPWRTTMWTSMKNSGNERMIKEREVENTRWSLAMI